ncbi:hypothetical protein FPV67DRAFT_927798 [Lyophyllum atratum]|nr:hypothetical protein FPV67DRAFT_927798 [Lyophyllum atratum]
MQSMARLPEQEHEFGDAGCIGTRDAVVLSADSVGSGPFVHKAFNTKIAKLIPANDRLTALVPTRALESPMLPSLAVFQPHILQRFTRAVPDDLQGMKEMLKALSGEQGQMRTELTSEVTSLRGEVNRLTGENQGLRGEVSRLNGEVSRLNGEVGRLNGEVNRLNGEVGRLTGENQQLTGEVNRLTVENQGLRDEVAGYHDEAKDLEGWITVHDTKYMDHIRKRHALNCAQAQLARVLKIELPEGVAATAPALSRAWRDILSNLHDEPARVAYANSRLAVYPGIDKPSPPLLAELCKRNSHYRMTGNRVAHPAGSSKEAFVGVIDRSDERDQPLLEEMVLYGASFM